MQGTNHHISYFLIAILLGYYVCKRHKEIKLGMAIYNI